MAMRLVIECASRLFGEGLKRLLEDDHSIEVVGVFDESSFFAEFDKVLELKPDAILASYTPDINILLKLAEDHLANNRLRILLIGDSTVRFFSDKHLKDLILKGVIGVLPPSADSDLLRKALKAVLLGELWLDRNTLTKILVSMRHPERQISLAKREKEIVLHICRGYRNKEIAQKLNISEQTVKSHCNRIYRKLGVSDRLQLALYSYRIWPGIPKF
jgi:DNA-binding NarL/FixJ family response regulator